MPSKEKDHTQTTQTIQPKQQILSASPKTDFTTQDVKQQMQQVEREVRAVMEGAIVDPTKLGFNFTI
jgi:ribulose kinase